MLFSGITFIYLFLPITLIVYYGLLRKSRSAQNVFLLIMSLLFYAWGEPKFVLIMSASIVANWLFGLLVGRAKSVGNLSRMRLFVSLSVVLNLSLLFVFKYLGFAGRVFESAFGISSRIPEIALPIGISFFTFQAMSYVIDVSRGKGEMQKNILNVGLYISFFPQLIAGPIVRCESVADEIKNRRENLEDFFSGFSLFIIGHAKKVLLANSFGLLADEIFDSLFPAAAISSPLAWLGAIAYTFQIFFDFGGYSDMARGLGRMFGFHFDENFNYPYISTSITEFWRRWHISLGTWFRDYVYIPLGGSRVGKLRLIFNLFAVWCLTGIWHGANFTFMLWGIMYFVLLVIEKLTKLDKAKRFPALRWIVTMFFVIIGWVLFRSPSLTSALGYLRCMFSGGFTSPDFPAYLSQNLPILICGALFSVPLGKIIPKKFAQSAAGEILGAAALVALFVLCIASLASSSYNPFIYFNF